MNKVKQHVTNKLTTKHITNNLSLSSKSITHILNITSIYLTIMLLWGQ
jgi:hypothetical protein